MQPSAILETILYARDLGSLETFYRDVLGLEPIAKAEARHVFYRIGDQMLLIFNPDKAATQPVGPTLPPRHGANGAGHVCFAATANEVEAWAVRLRAAGIAIEADFEWPRGGRSIYFRDPAGNSLEFAEPGMWGIA